MSDFKRLKQLFFLILTLGGVQAFAQAVPPALITLLYDIDQNRVETGIPLRLKIKRPNERLNRDDAKKLKPTFIPAIGIATETGLYVSIGVMTSEKQGLSRNRSLPNGHLSIGTGGFKASAGVGRIFEGDALGLPPGEISFRVVYFYAWNRGTDDGGLLNPESGHHYLGTEGEVLFSGWPQILFPVTVGALRSFETKKILLTIGSRVQAPFF